MKIDGNELAIRQNDLDREGRHEEAMAIKKEFLKQVRESGDHCPCKEACPHHGNCFECVTLHRGHRNLTGHPAKGAWTYTGAHPGLLTIPHWGWCGRGCPPPPGSGW